MLNAILVASLLAVTIPPAPGNRISDGAGLLSDGQTQELTTLFQDVETRQGVKLGLLTVSNLDDDPKAVSVRTLNFWNMTPDSVLLLISTNPRKVFLQPGSNLQYRFDERTSVGIIRDHIVPALKSGRYGAGILNGFHAVSNSLPGPVAAPPPNTGARPEPRPVVMEPIAITAPAPKSEGHPFLIFLLVSGSIVALILGVRYVLRKRREEQERQDELDASYRRSQRLSALDNQTGIVAQGSPANTYDPNTGVRGVSGTTAPAPTTVVNNVSTGGGGGSDLLTGVLIGEAISSPRERVVERVVERERPSRRPDPEPVYTPPPSPPRRSRSSDDDDSSSRSSSGGGGGGFDWGSSSSSSSDSGGGGGSDWGSSGGGFDSGGGGGGGSDW